MTQQTEALRLADALETLQSSLELDAAAELRRLHDENEVLKPWRDTVYRVHDALRDAGWHPGRTDDLITDIIKAKGDEMRRLHALNVDKTEIIASHVANYERLRAVNAQLLEALKTLRDNSSLSSHQLEIILPAINAAKENT